MSVPSNSPKYVCSKCRHKIAIVDIEEIFRSQLETYSFIEDRIETNEVNLSSFPDTDSLYDYWNELTTQEKRVIVEQIVNRIAIGQSEINIEFSLMPDCLKTMTTGQQHDTKATKVEDAKKPPQMAKPPSDEVEESPLSPTLNEPLMNETQAAKFLGISRMTLIRKRYNGEIKFFRVGFRVLYSKEKHLLPFLELCEKMPLKQSR